jgi:hypothetical protein
MNYWTLEWTHTLSLLFFRYEGGVWPAGWMHATKGWLAGRDSGGRGEASLLIAKPAPLVMDVVHSSPCFHRWYRHEVRRTREEHLKKKSNNTYLYLWAKPTCLSSSSLPPSWLWSQTYRHFRRIYAGRLDARLLAEPAPRCLDSLLPDYIHRAMMNVHRSEKGGPLTTISTVYAAHDAWRFLVLQIWAHEVGWQGRRMRQGRVPPGRWWWEKRGKGYIQTAESHSIMERRKKRTDPLLYLCRT